MDPTEPAIDTPELLAVIDRLEALLEHSELTEIEVEADGTAVVLRTQGAIAPPPVAPAGPPVADQAPDTGSAKDDAPTANAIVAPLTGLYYGAPSPGAEPYVKVGAEVHVGQVIGLIEAMKLFNEIKSDMNGRVARICVSDGALVKARQPLIELATTRRGEAAK